MSMRKYLFALLICLFLPGLALAEVSSIDNGYKEQITSYRVDATLNNNGSINVTETIAYDFGNNEKHGTFRYIPTVYQGRRGNKWQSLQVKSVTDGAGTSQPYEESMEGNSGVIKVGDANRLVTGIKTYRFEYSLSNMISSDKDGDRFRWDAIGTGWNVPIKNVIITLNTDDQQTSSIRTIDCYIGAAGSSDLCKYSQEKNTIVVGKDYLFANNGITLDVLFNPGTFTAPSKLELFLWESNWYIWLPLIAFLGFFLLWFEKGRDPKGRGTIVPMYDPPKGISPFEASIILDDKISKKSLPAAIIDLAVKGYIKIHKKDTKILFVTNSEYELELLKPLPITASPVEQKVSSLFFIGRTRVSMKDLGESFPVLYQSLHKEAYKSVTDKGYFVVNPTISRIIFFGVAIALLIFGLITAIYLLLSPLGFTCLLFPGLIATGFAFIMPVKTKAGAIIKEDLLGLKMYIKTAEIDRIKFHNAPAKSPEKFEELLPYAIIFGLEKEWAAEFKDVYKTPPTWYDGNMATFTVIGLTHDLGSFSDAAIASAASSAGGGAGGFAGGGGGGGGGGSW